MKEKNAAATPTHSTKPTLNELLGDTWLAKVLSEEVEEIEPDQPIRDGETEIGTMTTLERKLYSHTSKLEVLAKMAKAQAEYKHDAEVLEAANNLEHQTRTISNIVWSLIQDRISGRGDSIGLRKGFVIVNNPESSESNPLEAIMRSLR